jgi:tellurite resistance protein TerC
MLFALALRPLRGNKEALEFLTGYLIELSLSMDNVFVIALIFAYFQIPGQYQHRVLFWGIVGALIMRGLMIGAGVALISWLQWILYVLGAFVLFTGIKMLFVETEVHPERNRVVKWVRKLYPVTSQLDGQKFVTVWQGRRALTPLALVLVMVETTDLVFALDSIPAIFAVTTKPFIVFTSNVFAILGLRSLYFVLAGALDYFRYLKSGLSLVLVFIGAKMLLDPHDTDPPRWFQVEIPISISLLVVGVIILISIVLSIIIGRRKQRSAGQ